MSRLVEIDPDAVRAVHRDVTATRDAIAQRVRPLRRAAADLGVDLGGIDDVLALGDRLTAHVLPVVGDHQRRAEHLASLRYRGRFGQAIPVVDREVSPAPPTLTPRFSEEDGLTRVSWAAATASEEIADEEGFSVSRSVSDWFAHRWDDVTAAVDAGTDRVARAAVDVWHGAGDALGAGWDAVAGAWDGATGAAGEWIDENLAGVREWIGDHVGVFRWLAKALRVVGWVVVAVGVVLAVALGIIGALGGTAVGAVFGFGVGEVATGPAGALAGAMLGLEVAGVGFSLVSVGDFLDVLADWGEGEIDGQELVQRGTAELALAVTSLIGIGAVVKGGKKLLEHLPPSWAAKAEEFLGRLFSRGRTERDEPGNPDAPETPHDPEAPHDRETPRDPGTPNHPETPRDPDTPNHPEIPHDPDTPDDSKTPDDSETVDEPKDPDEPENPIDSGNVLPLDPARPWKFDIARDEDRFDKAHTIAKHGAVIPLRREDAGADGKSIEGRIYGDRPWDRRENTSSRWLSDEVMQSTVEEHVRQHWSEIVDRLATDGVYKNTFDAGHPVGEGFINANRGTGGPRQAVYGTTNDVTVVIRVNEETGEPYVVTAYPNLTHLYPR